METNLIRPSDMVAIGGGVAFAFGSIACMMLSVHLARAKDLAGMKSILKLAGGFTLASCCLLAATTYCVVHRCEEYCRTLSRMTPLVHAEQMSTQATPAVSLQIHTKNGHDVHWNRNADRSVGVTFL